MSSLSEICLPLIGAIIIIIFTEKGIWLLVM